MIEKPGEKMKSLSADYASKTITMEELDKECAYWFMDCFDEIRPKPEPTAPREYFDYKNMPFERRMKVSSDFWQLPIIKNYLEIKERITNENNANLFHLKGYLAMLPEGDFVSRQKFKDKITEFELKDYA